MFDCIQQKPSAGNGRSGRGFTLIEMVVAITLLAIAASVATPAFNDAIQHHRVHQAALRVSADLRLARRTAQHTGQTVHVDLDTDAHTVTIRDMMDLEKSDQSQTLSLQGSTYQCQISDIDLGGGNTITINGYGIYETNGSLTLRSGPHLRTIVIEPEKCSVE